MPQKKRFVLRIDPDEMRALERWAADEFRSTNAQLEYLLHRALKEAGRAPKRGDAPVDPPPAADEG